MVELYVCNIRLAARPRPGSLSLKAAGVVTCLRRSEHGFWAEAYLPSSKISSVQIDLVD